MTALQFLDLRFRDLRFHLENCAYALSDAGLIRSTKLIRFPGIRIAVRVVVFEIPGRIVYGRVRVDEIIERALKQNDAAAIMILHCIGSNDIPRAVEQEDAPERGQRTRFPVYQIPLDHIVCRTGQQDRRSKP